MSLKPLAEQVVAVIGASSGIGRATALGAARRGAKVVVAARDEEALATLVDEITKSGGRAEAVAADVSNVDDMINVADHAVAIFGGIDSWVHVAAIAQFSRFEDTTPEEYRRIMEVNFLGNVHGAKAALPYLCNDGGALIHVSSIEARRAVPLHSAYAASKHAVDGFVEALRVELRHDNVPVSVTNVMPASANTPLFEKCRSKLGVHPMPVPPIYPPESVANVILFACEHPCRDLIAGGAGKVVLLIQRFLPSLLDMFAVRFGIRAQKTQLADYPGDNFYAPLPGMGKVAGSFSGNTLRHSAYNYVQTHDPFRSIKTRLRSFL